MDKKQRLIDDALLIFESAAEKMALQQMLGSHDDEHDIGNLLTQANLPSREIENVIRDTSIFKSIAQIMATGIGGSSLSLIESVVAALLLHKVEALNLPTGPAIAAGVALIVAHHGIKPFCAKWLAGSDSHPTADSVSKQKP